MLLQTEFTNDLFSIGFHCFLLGFLTAWLLLRLWIRDLKAQNKTLSRELEKEYEYNALKLAEDR